MSVHAGSSADGARGRVVSTKDFQPSHVLMGENTSSAQWLRGAYMIPAIPVRWARCCPELKMPM